MKRRYAEQRMRELLEQLDKLRREYNKKADPLLKELADIKSLEPPQPVTLPDGTVMSWCGPSFYDED